MKIDIKRFGVEYNPLKEEKAKNKMTKNIIIVLCVFVVFALILTFGFAWLIRNNLACFSANNTIDSLWIGSLASYLGGTIGGILSGAFAFLGVYFTIKYYKESDEQKEKSAIQPFLQVSVNQSIDAHKWYSLGDKSKEKEMTQEIKFNVKNIGNGYASTVVLHTGFVAGGIKYNKLIATGEIENLCFFCAPDDLENGISFGIQYIDAKRNEYVQEYEIIKKYGTIDIECGYPEFIKQI